MTKKILALVLTLAMALSLCGAASAAEPEEQQTAATRLLMAMGIVSGTTDGSLELERNVTRAEAAKLMAYAKLGSSAAALTAQSAPFADVSAKHWAAPFIAYCAENGIIAGYGNGSFGPNDSVTAKQLMAMALRVLGYGSFTGSDWGSQVEAVTAALPTLSGIALKNTPALRSEVFAALYQTLFTPIKTADGKTETTIAKQQNVEVVKLSESRMAFSVNGIELNMSFAISAGETFPSATAVAKAAAAGVPCVLLQTDKGAGLALLLSSSAATEKVYPTGGVSEFVGSTGKFVLWDKSEGLLYPTDCKTGEGDILSTTKTLGGTTLDEKTVFILNCNDSRFRCVKGRSNLSSNIYSAQYSVYTADDATTYVYISYSEKSNETLSSAQVFLVNPRSFSVYGSGSDAYFTTEGTLNSEIDTLRFNNSCGNSFFSGSPKPGIYKGINVSSGIVTDMYSTQPVNQLWRDSGASGPMVGISYKDGVFEFGMGGGNGKVALIAKNAEATAFCFYIDSKGNVSSDTRSLSAVTSDDKAYVWGTLDSGGMILNLYIVYSDNADWNGIFSD